MQFKTLALVVASLALAKAHKHGRFHHRRQMNETSWGDWPTSTPESAESTPVADTTSPWSTPEASTPVADTTSPSTTSVEATSSTMTWEDWSSTSSTPVADTTTSSSMTWEDWNSTSSTPVADASTSSSISWEDWGSQSTTVKSVPTTITTEIGGSTTELTTTVEITETLTITNTVYQTNQAPSPVGEDQGTLTKSGTTTTTITVIAKPTGAGAGPGDQVPSDETAGNDGGAGNWGSGSPEGQGQGCTPQTVTTTAVVVSTITVTPTPAIPTFGGHKPEDSTPADLTKTSSTPVEESTAPAKPTGFPGFPHNGTKNETSWEDWTGSTGFLTVSKYATATPSGWKP